MRRAEAQAVVHWEAAHAAVLAAVRRAEAIGIRVNAAVADSGGQLAAFLRMPGAYLHSIDIAIDKACTAAGFGLPTAAWSAALQAHSPAVRDGLPLRADGRLIGGIGVSGGSEDEDEICARAGLAAIGAED